MLNYVSSRKTTVLALNFERSILVVGFFSSFGSSKSRIGFSDQGLSAISPRQRTSYSFVVSESEDGFLASSM